MTVPILPINQQFPLEPNFTTLSLFEGEGVNPLVLTLIDEWSQKYNENLSPEQMDKSIYSSDVISLLAIDEILDEWIQTNLDQDDVSSIMEQFDRDQIGESISESYTVVSKDSLENIDILSFLLRLSFLRKNPPLAYFSNIMESEMDEAISTLEKTVIDHAQSIMIDTNLSLYKKINSPREYFPNSITKQLLYIANNWNLREERKTQLLRVLDFWNEQHKARIGGSGQPQAPDFSEYYPENYSEDSEWMPEVVLLAKNAYVYLSQLSRKYEKFITKLNEIPDEELQDIRDRGFSALWLIGLWERSAASEVIKQRMGNPEAVGSAYSLWDYVIAEDLGGHNAYYDLSERAGKIGLRLASDMVPNHTGIYSKWVLEQPDWFIQVDEPPFQSYKFESEDLIDDPNISIYLEDHYYHHSDAAVVFKRVDKHTGEVRYIYHGNDGTSIPWNDTAQLNYLKSEVREAVMNTIIHVARMFPVIRFDAAMVLTKKHIQRLWFPEPGSGGDIPSRSRFGLTRDEFNSLLPNEFWRDVVERIATDVPHTLLIAEAFWMLEGYFVRSLGMHRVYNSAFMHMLRDELNKEYRGLIKDTLEYDPRILQRYVNFMSNPDEDTAIGQFGDSDKYFGICLFMITLPGLPMFGHGQIEGYREKYGMEFKRDYWNEDPREDLISHHEELIFPLMKLRGLFAPVANFRLYDVYNDGMVNENLFAISNNDGHRYFLVVYNNKFDRSSGWVNTSAAFNSKILGIDTDELKQTKLADDLDISKYYGQSNYFCVFEDFHTNMFYIRSIRELCDDGLYVELEGYRFIVLTNFQSMPDRTGELEQLCSDLAGKPVEFGRVAALISSESSD